VLGVVLRTERGQRGEDRRAHAAPDDAQHGHHQHEGGRQRRDAALSHAGSQRCVHPEVDLHHAQPQDARSHQQQHLAHAGDVQAQRRAVAEAQAHQVGKLHQQVQRRADHRAPGQPVNVPAAR